MKISKRMKLAVIAFLIVFFLLLLRLAEIQLFFTESFSKKKINLIQESVKQRTEEVLISDGRGSFLDRNGQALTGKSEPAVVLFPFLLTQDWPIKKLVTSSACLKMNCTRHSQRRKNRSFCNKRKSKHFRNNPSQKSIL